MIAVRVNRLDGVDDAEFVNLHVRYFDMRHDNPGEPAQKKHL